MFRILLSAEARARLDAEQAESERLYGLTDRWLADALLQMSRAARMEAPHLKPEDHVYDNTFVWHVLPELARRLGARKFLPSEREDFDVNHMTDVQLRERAMGCLSNISTSTYYKMSGWTMLLRESANGNPVVYAVDRLSPGNLAQPDSIVKRLVEIAGHRKVPYEGVWTPAMMSYK